MENDNNDNIQTLTQEVLSLKQKLKDSDTVIQSLQEDNSKLQQFIDSNLTSFFKVCKENNMDCLNQTKKHILECLDGQKNNESLRERMLTTFKSIQNKVNDLHSVQIKDVD